jgi:predicted FMN-binding regulatory protein PaiB
MYTPKHFAETRAEIRHGLIRDYPFATVVVNAAAGLVANHLPFEWADGVLRGHVARGNELARLDGAEVLAVSTSARTGIRPSRKRTAKCPPGTTRWRTCTAG